MADLQVKLVGKHVKGCFAVENVRRRVWETQWGPIAYGKHGDATVGTERRYGKNGRVFKTWLRFVCNDSACRAELHVDGDFILAAAKEYQLKRGAA